MNSIEKNIKIKGNINFISREGTKFALKEPVLNFFKKKEKPYKYHMSYGGEKFPFGIVWIFEFSSDEEAKKERFAGEFIQVDSVYLQI